MFHENDDSSNGGEEMIGFEELLSEIRDVSTRAEEAERVSCYLPQIRNGKPHNKFGIFRSGSNGTCIRNAITGLIFDPRHRVGSSTENYYFTTTITSGRYGHGGSDKHLKAFYDSPESYEKHQKCKVSTEIKTNWNMKRDTMRAL